MQKFQGWEAVATRLRSYADEQQTLAENNSEMVRLNEGQRASLHAIAQRIGNNGVIIADEVGMGKTRIAAEVARSVKESGGRVAIVIPPGLGFQWHEELRTAGVEAPTILRSLYAYRRCWTGEDAAAYKEWFEESVVLVSHAFTNWRLGEKTDPWRWALLPEIYANWRERTQDRLPRGYYKQKGYEWAEVAAQSIINKVPKRCKLVEKKLDELLEKVAWGQSLYEGSKYSQDNQLRTWLEFSVGLGLGVFDLIIVDEAHKSRGIDSGLTRLLKNLIQHSKHAKRLAITATPVELNIEQWKQTLSRIDVDPNSNQIDLAIEKYDEAVRRVRQLWRQDETARNNFKAAAAEFEQALTPYLIRRDKREDATVKLFQEKSKLSVNDYRRESEVSIDTASLSLEWKRAICAAEALSIVSSSDCHHDLKRLRLTVGSGHGIAVLLDQIKRDAQNDLDEDNEPEKDDKPKKSIDEKQQKRAQWWLNVIEQSILKNEHSLFDHPSILAAVQAIEEITNSGEKVLVFGRFVRPLKALVNLLNSREMVRRLTKGISWNQSRIEESDELEN